MATSPEEESIAAVQQIQNVLTRKDCQIRELQRIRLYDDQWRSVAYPIPGLVRSTDAVVDSTGENVFLREAQSDPAKLYQLQISTEEVKLLMENFNTKTWSLIYYNEVIMIGGVDKATSQSTSELIGVRFNDDSTPRPERVLPDMPTRRFRTTALVYNHPQSGANYIIVIGGEDKEDDDGVTLKTVEIFEHTTNTWCQAESTPEALSCSSGAIVNGYIYLLGGWSKRGQPTSSAYRCNVNDLIGTCMAPQQANVDIWKKLPDLPVQEATCTSFQNTLVVVGGVANKVVVRDIRYYNEKYRRWDVIGYLQHPRRLCFTVGLQNKLIVLGGKKSDTKSVDTIEVYTHYQ